MEDNFVSALHGSGRPRLAKPHIKRVASVSRLLSARDGRKGWEERRKLLSSHSLREFF